MEASYPHTIMDGSPPRVAPDRSLVRTPTVSLHPEYPLGCNDLLASIPADQDRFPLTLFMPVGPHFEVPTGTHKGRGTRFHLS